MNEWVFPCGEDLSENRRIRPRAPAYEAHLQGDARASQRLPAPSHSLSGTLQIEARTQRGSVCMAPRFLGLRALFRASETTLPRFALHPDSEDSGLTPFFVWSLLRI